MTTTLIQEDRGPVRVLTIDGEAQMNVLSRALVADLIMPLVGAVLPGNEWRTFTVTPLHFKLGDFLGAVLDFLQAVLTLDLIEAFLRAEDHLPEIAGQAFNIGGGRNNTISLRELVERITALNGSLPEIAHGPWRFGDQRWYVSDPRKFESVTGWRPKTNAEQGIRQLHEWISVNRRGAREARVVGS